MRLKLAAFGSDPKPLRAMLSFLSACFWRGGRVGDEGLARTRGVEKFNETTSSWACPLFLLAFVLA